MYIWSAEEKWSRSFLELFFSMHGAKKLLQKLKKYMNF